MSEDFSDISGDRNAVVRGNNLGTIFTGDIHNYFMGLSVPLSQLTRAEQFRTLIEGRTKDFVGRDFIFQGINDLLAGHEHFKSGYVLVTGEPGVGKTSLAAQIVKLTNCAHHFNTELQNIRTTQDFFSNICAQLILMYGLDYRYLPDTATKDSGFLTALLRQIIEKNKGAKVLIVVDGLDEVDRSEEAVPGNVLSLPFDLPEDVFFILTSRPQYSYTLSVNHRRDIAIIDNSSQNKDDIKVYIEKFLRENEEVLTPVLTSWKASEQELTETLVKKSEGNFMYLVYILRDIAAGKTLNSPGIENLPVGLGEYYERHWRHMRELNPEAFRDYIEPVVCMLATAREPVTIAQVVEWTRDRWPSLNPGKIYDVIKAWWQFLNEDKSRNPAVYSLYHKSFNEFLYKEAGLWLYEDEIIKSAFRKIPGIE